MLRHLFWMRGDDSEAPPVAGDWMCGMITSLSSSSLPANQKVRLLQHFVIVTVSTYVKENLQREPILASAFRSVPLADEDRKW